MSEEHKIFHLDIFWNINLNYKLFENHLNSDLLYMGIGLQSDHILIATNEMLISLWLNEIQFSTVKRLF